VGIVSPGDGAQGQGTHETLPAMQYHPRPSLPATRTRFSENLHSIVLAAGCDRRPEGHTAALHGAPIPRQFCSFGGSRSLLQQTLDRLGRVTPPRRTFVIVDHLQLARATWQIAGYPGATLVAQPCDRGTAAGAFLPLLHVLLRDPSALVLLTPSDHGVEDVSAYARAVARAVNAVRDDPSLIVVFGAPEGALFDTRMTVGRADRLLALYRPLQDLVRHLQLWLDALAGGERARLTELYRLIPELDFTRDVLGNAPGLAVHVLPRRVGWTDLGTPDRLTAWALRRHPLPVSRDAPVGAGRDAAARFA